MEISRSIISFSCRDGGIGVISFMYPPSCTVAQAIRCLCDDQCVVSTLFDPNARTIGSWDVLDGEIGVEEVNWKGMWCLQKSI